MLPSDMTPGQPHQMHYPLIQQNPSASASLQFGQLNALSNLASTGSATTANMQAFHLRPAQPVTSMFSSPILTGFKRLLAEMKMRQFDSIRFAAYRTASKLRYIQQRTLFCFVDVCRVVEIFREFGLHHVTDPAATLDYASTACLLNRLYTQLSSAKPTNVATTALKICAETLEPGVINSANEILFSWLVYALDVAATGRIGVNSLKIALSTLTNSKPTDKLRYHFTLLSDPSGALIPMKFEAYLQDLLRLPISIFEGTNFYFTPQASKALLSGRSKNILLEEFLERMSADPGSQMLVWLTIFHRLASVENIRHNVRCEGCKREPISGLRYKCTRCQHYNMCQDCFWTGVTTSNHTNAHDVKEYCSSSKSHSRQFGHSLRKSFQLSRLSSSTSTAPSNSDARVTQSNIDTRTSGQLPKRAMLGSIFEWNSAPDNVDQNGAVRNGSTSSQPFLAPSFTMGQSLGQRQVLYRSSMPVASVRSPLPHRRLQQLNPALFSAPNNQNIPPLVQMNPGTVPHSGTLTTSGAPRTFMSSFQRDSQLPGQSAPGNNILGTRLHSTAPMSVQEAQNNLQFTINPSICPPPGAPITFGSGQNVELTFNSSAMSAPGFATCEYDHTHAQLSDPSSQRIMTHQASTPVVSSLHAVQPEMLINYGKFSRNVDSQCREEHQLIAKYSAQLAAANAFSTQFEKMGNVADSPQTQKQLIAELQSKNIKILKEIERLREEQQKQAAVIAAAAVSKPDLLLDGDGNVGGTISPVTFAQLNKTDQADSQDKSEKPKLISELNVLRQRKDELEARMNNLQRNRTELMLQLETLVRLLSLSGATVQQRDACGVYQTDPISRDVHPASQFPSTPIGTARFGHQTRAGMRPPENPPRRSSSLCHTSEDRVLKEDRQQELRDSVRMASGVASEVSWDQAQFGDKFMRENLLSPISDLIAEPHLSRTPAGTQLSRGDEASRLRGFLDKHERPVLNPERTGYTSFSSTSVGTAGRTSTYYGMSNAQNKKSPIVRSVCPSDRIYSTSLTDSGSDVYLYSDPEFGTSSGFTSLARRDINNQTRMQKRLSAQLHSHSNGQAPTSFTDNYEYPAHINPSEATDHLEDGSVGQSASVNN
ncbi:unnamed protein product [Dicrocoelium dendriticum]|nr:unnamed protein product [Dicrocoelium dendriticum]